MKRNESGFTLMELGVTLAIVALLSVFAVVTYQQPLQRTHQESAKIALLELANEMEQYFDLHHTYVGANLSLSHRHYRLEIMIADRTHFTLAAIPLAVTSGDQCGTFYLDQAGTKWVSGQGALEDCW